MIQNHVFRVLRCLANHDYEQAAELLQCDLATLEATMKEYFTDHERIILDQRARSAHFTRLVELDSGIFEVEQTICDPEAHNDWSIKLEVSSSAIRLHRIGIIDLNS